MHEKRADAQSSRKRTRAALLDAAERSLARFGYPQLTMELLADDAGVSRRTAYLYFRGKEEAVLGTVDRIVDRVDARLAELAASAAPSTERLLHMLVARVLIRAEGVHGYHQALDELVASLRAALLERRRAYFAREARQLTAVVRQGQRAGELGAGDARKIAELLILCTNALLPRDLGNADFADRVGLARRAHSVARLLLDGLRPRPVFKKAKKGN